MNKQLLLLVSLCTMSSMVRASSEKIVPKTTSTSAPKTEQVQTQGQVNRF